MHKVLNKEGPRDHTYESTFQNETVVIYARSDAAARQKSIEHWHIRKKDAPLLTIKLVKERSDLAFVS